MFDSVEDTGGGCFQLDSEEEGHVPFPHVNLAAKYWCPPNGVRNTLSMLGVAGNTSLAASIV